jgi:predicted RNA-binding protein YlqC (UPF0109 family)
MRYFLDLVLQRLIRHPDDVDLRQIEEPGHTTFQISVHPEDIGRVIGRNGKTINAIRGLLNAAGSRNDTRVTVQLFENSAA